MDSQTQELQALEARLRDTEERLKERQSRNPSPARRNNDTDSFDKQQPRGDTFDVHKNDGQGLLTTSPRATNNPKSQSVSASTMSQWRPS